MPFETSWYMKNYIVHQRLYGELTLDDLRAANVDYLAYVTTGLAPVHALVDVRDVTKFPFQNIPALLMSMNSGDLDPSAFGRTMITGVNPPVRFVINVMNRFWDFARIEAVDSIEDAVEKLVRIDQRLSAERQ